MSVKKIGVGVIGGGKAGRNLARAISAGSSAGVVMFCTRHRETAREAARECGVSRWTTDYGSMLSEPGIDAVVVASPDEFHHGHVIMAFRAGKHVLCEKPMCRTLEEADEMIDGAEANRNVFMVGFTERFNHQCLEARKAIDAGLIGMPRMITARRCHSRAVVRGRSWLNDAGTGGVLNYVGTHNIDLTCWFMGAPPERVYAEMGQLVLKGQDFTDCAVMTLKFRNNSIATLSETFAYPRKYPCELERSVEIVGDRGVIFIDFNGESLKFLTDSSHPAGNLKARRPVREAFTLALRAETEHFLQCIRERKTPVTGGKEGRMALRIALAAGKSAAAGKAVSL